MNDTNNPLTTLPEADESVSIDDIVGMADHSENVLEKYRDKMLAPYPRKNAPTFSSSALAELCGIDRARLKYLASKGTLPPGQSFGHGRSKTFTLEETIQWIVATSSRGKRPEGVRGRVYAIGNFKGGVAKTTTTVATAQALTLRGRKVLLIDCDPQGSATQLCGYAPETEVDDYKTLLPLFYGDQSNVEYAIHKTYWHNLDLIPATTYLADADAALVAELLKERRFEFWDVLNKGLQPILDKYDVVLIDTPPQLSQITTNALMAADAVVLPCPPDGMDFASSTRFWRLFSEVAKRLPSVRDEKRYDFINILMTKVKANEASTTVQGWMKLAYNVRVLPFSIPESTIQIGAASMLSTVFDFAKSSFSSAAYARIRQPYDQLADHLDRKLVRSWAKESQQ
ncbi:cobyrinic acid a,c-diamide synthase [Burkholderia pseudomallei]|nr:cobyrinic acid a,c-diamide synthase [Burkholderia pseudomallei]CAJ6692984.1 cobyrinic acid a,c-diamide synthase [Burkholderia pseudomallei]